MKTIEKSILLGFIFTILFSFLGFNSKCENISDKVFRLHVLANSDSSEDQQLKLCVRDKVLEYSKYIFNDAKNKDSAKQITQKHLEDIKNVAQQEVYDRGYDYKVNVKIDNMYFNTRQYGNVTMPAGNYDALKIFIGDSKGHNWWCVMFPPICLPAAEESKQLDDVLDPSQMNIVENGNKYKIKFKIVELINGLIDYMKGFGGVSVA